MVLIIIGAFLFIVGIVWWAVAVTRGTTGIGSLVVIVLAMIALVFGAKLVERRSPQPKTPKYQPIEYPVSEYRLQLRIVEFEGQRDTTYVLVKKIKEYEICQ